MPDRWYATDYPYAGGWLITVGAPWEPGHPERILATARNGEVAARIVNDHNALAVRNAALADRETLPAPLDRRRIRRYCHR